MKFLNWLSLIPLLLGFPSGAEAAFKDKEALHYPLNMGTADTLRSDEWLFTIPPWGWVAYGVHKNLTVAFDYPVALMLGMAAGSIKWQLAGETGDTALALELYGWHIPYKFSDKRKDEFLVEHWGGQHWVRLNWSQRISDSMRLHFYGGGNFTDYERYAPNTKDTFPEAVFENAWTPTYGAGLEWKWAPWIYFHGNYTKGNTFLFMDQIARKELASWGFGMAPFSESWWGIFSSMRIEAAAIWTKVEPVPYQATLPIPLFIYLYWQWGSF